MSPPGDSTKSYLVVKSGGASWRRYHVAQIFRDEQGYAGRGNRAFQGEQAITTQRQEFGKVIGCRCRNVA